jgi:hypothetical protein
MNNFLQDIGEFFKLIGSVIIAFGLLVCAFLFIVGGVIGFIELCSPGTSKEYSEKNKADAIPHVYSEVDGCTIYKWRDNSYWHYMTKCATTVTTEGHHSKMVGKISKDVSETIVTKKGE